MFKISIIEAPTEQKMVVEGTLTKPWVAELRKTWRESSELPEGHKRVIDLANVTLIDDEGEEAILDLMREGAAFCCSGVLTKHVVKRIAQKHRALTNRALDQACSKDR